MKHLGKYRQIVFALCTLYVVFFLSCNKEEPIPAYIHIDQFTLTTDYVNEGSASHKILDAWIYVDDQLVGAFEMPCTVPVLITGNRTIKVVPGIKENGISETRVQYPFYERYETNLELIPGRIDTLHPSTVYTLSADIAWTEDFEGAGHSFCDNNSNQDTTLQHLVSTPDVFELTGSGLVEISSGTYIGKSCNKYPLPKAGSPVYLELNYYCNSDFNVGIIGYNGSNIETQSISLSMRPTEGWNKIYVNLTNEVSSAISSNNFSIFFSMVKDPAKPTSWFYLDNIKLIH